MKKITLTLAFIAATVIAQAQTLEECQQAAEQNYPIVRKYQLIEKSTDYTLSNIGKGWLPQISATAQATVQSDVVTLPEGMTTMLSQTGMNVKGLKKDQYRVGIDISQTIYEGGAIASQKEVARLQGEVEKTQNDVDIYNLRKRVNELYFGLLLIEQRMKMNEELQNVLNSSEKKLESMFRNGTAAESDYITVKAERMTAEQQMVELKAQNEAFRTMLAHICGIEINDLKMPDNNVDIGKDNMRPELRLFNTRLQLADAQEKALDAALMPRLSFFASGYYGYPGYDMYHDMFSHEWSLNGMMGLRLTWNIGALYTRKNDKAKISTMRLINENGRDMFLFNTRIDNLQHVANMKRYHDLMESDWDIIKMRTKVRKAAESKLDHGIIDVNDLIREIYNENNAKISMEMHRVEFLKQTYDFKFTNNN